MAEGGYVSDSESGSYNDFGNCDEYEDEFQDDELVFGTSPGEHIVVPTFNHESHSGLGRIELSLGPEQQENGHTQVRLPHYVYNYACPPEVENPVLLSRSNESFRSRKLKELPICQPPIRTQLLEAIQNNVQITIINGKTGCGKTTLLPQFIIELRRYHTTLIFMAMPRRVAVLKSKATISANVCGPSVESDVIGYHIHNDKEYTVQSNCIIMTSGVLLLLLKTLISTGEQTYPITHLILDEAHELDCDTEACLALIPLVLQKHSTIKVFIMSATIETTSFENYFTGKNLTTQSIECMGLVQPIQYLYHNSDADRNNNLYEDISNVVYDFIDKNPHADNAVLIFLPGLKEIRDALNALKEHDKFNDDLEFKILHSKTLYGKKSANLDMCSPGKRLIYLATNIAETALTLTKVTFVVDSGLEKVIFYEIQTESQGCHCEFISRSSADQRAGRAGRTKPGICYRMYTEQRYNDLLPSKQRKTNSGILSFCLKMTDMKLTGGTRNFLNSFLHPFSPEDIQQTFDWLKSHDLIDVNDQITTLGKKVLQLPVDINEALQIVHGIVCRCIDPILDIICAKKDQGIFENNGTRMDDIAKRYMKTLIDLEIQSYAKVIRTIW